MSKPPLPFRRHLPCSMTLEILPFPDKGILRLDFRLSLPSFGFDLTAGALVSLDVLPPEGPQRDDFLVAIGRDAIGQSLRVIAGRSPLIHSPIIPASTPTESTPERRIAAFDDDLPSLGFTSSDQEMLRAYNISPH